MVTLDYLKTKIDDGPFTRIVVAFAIVIIMGVSGLQVWNNCSVYLMFFLQKALLRAPRPSASIRISDGRVVLEMLLLKKTEASSSLLT